MWDAEDVGVHLLFWKRIKQTYLYIAIYIILFLNSKDFCILIIELLSYTKIILIWQIDRFLLSQNVIQMMAPVMNKFTEHVFMVN